MKNGARYLLSVLLPALLLAGCAKGSSGNIVSSDLSSDVNSVEGDWRPHLNQDANGSPMGDAATVGPGNDALVVGKDSAPVDNADQDGDGHCAKGASDPMGKCKTFNDCDDKDAKRHPWATETCADVGIDNDCDGDAMEVDIDKDGKTDIGTACQTTHPGVCAAGTRRCDKGKIICKASFSPGQQKEICNGLDDDCDSTPDDGTLCVQGNTCQGKQGCRCGGGAACTVPSFCCGSSCQDLTASTNHCGACNTACGPNETCNSGGCRCGSTLGKPGAGPACPAGNCNGSSCQTCSPSKNLALSAAATSTGGGNTATNHGPEKMNDGLYQSSCVFHWVSAGSSPGGKWVEYRWASPQLVGRVQFDTSPAYGGACTTSSGRSLAGGKIQYWTGAAYKTVSTISGKTDDWDQAFSQVTTTRLRLYDLYATSATGQKSNPVIYEWQVFCQ